MSCGHCGLEPHATILCPFLNIPILTDRNIFAIFVANKLNLFIMNENDLKRLMVRQYLLYKKLVEIEDKIKGKNYLHSDVLLIKDFNEETDKIMDVIDKKGITI